MWFYPDSDEWDDHVYEYNVCEPCGYHFDSEWDLENVSHDWQAEAYPPSVADAS